METTKELREDIKLTEEKVKNLLIDFIHRNGTLELDINIYQEFIANKMGLNKKMTLFDVSLKVRI